MVVVYALVVTLALSVFGIVWLAPFAESWVVGAIFNSFLLFWSVMLFTGLVLAVGGVVTWRVFHRYIIPQLSA